jgi:c-di-AMP phosphodiesterase-like protein
MTNRIIILIAILCVTLTIMTYTWVGRQVREERQRTKVALLVHEGLARVVLTLPMGAYICVITDDPEGRWATSYISHIPMDIDLSITITRGDEVIVEQTDRQWIKFAIGDDQYTPVIIECRTGNHEELSAWIAVRATF